MSRLRAYLVLAALACGPLAAQTPAQRYFAEPALDQATLAPGGGFVAAVERLDDGGQAVVVFDGSGRSRRALSLPRERIHGLYWASRERLLLLAAPPDQAPGLIAVNRDGSMLRRLLPAGLPGRAAAGVQLVDLLPGDPSAVLVADDALRPFVPDLVRVDVFSGATEQAHANPGRIFRWLGDGRGGALAAMAWSVADDGGLVYELLAAHRSGAPLRPAWSLPLAEGSFTLHGLHPDGRQLLLDIDEPGAPSGLRGFDPRLRRLGEALVDTRGAGISALHWAADAAHPAWIETHRERRVREVFDPAAAQWLERLDRHLGATENLVLARSGDQALVLASSDRDAGSYWLYDIASDRLRRIGARKPWLRLGDTVPMLAVQVPARDGSLLPAYLTLPARPRGSLVIYPHGGPWSRDHWGYDPVVQFLANRGHAVLQVNFRGSRGFGHAFMMQGRRDWGGVMQTDLEDAIAWALDQGHAEPGRVGALGASYGGFAALRLLLAEASPLAAAAVFAPVLDLPGQIAHFAAQGNARAVAEWRMMVGDPDDPGLMALSPLTDAARLKRPLLLGHGLRDQRVPAAASRAFVKAAPAQVVQALWFTQAGHGLDRLEDRLRWYAAVESLFAAL